MGITWETIYTIERNTNYSSNSTEWNLLKLGFTENNRGNIFIYDRINTPHFDIFLGIITKKHILYFIKSIKQIISKIYLNQVQFMKNFLTKFVI